MAPTAKDFCNSPTDCGNLNVEKLCGGYCQSNNNGNDIANANTSSTGSNISGQDMDDILIVTARQSEPAILWANYLKARFDKITKQRGRQPFNFLHIRIDEEALTPDLTRRCQTTKLQIVILCSTLIGLPADILMAHLSVVLRPEIVLGILLEVPEERIMEIHRKALPMFKKWRRCAVHNQDQSLVGKVLGIATDILGRALCQRPICHNAQMSTSTTSDKCHSSGSGEAFTILPRKVKVGQSKVVALLNEPLAKDDVIRIRIEKTGEQLDVGHIKRRNPYTLQFSIPDSCMEVSTMIEIKIERNDVLLGCRPVKCESRLRELEQILKSQDSPVDFMCNSLGIATPDRVSLDSYMHHTFQRNVPPNFHLVSGPRPLKQHGLFTVKDSSAEEFPTLLHFAAKWGLEHLSMQLMECPGGEMAIEMRNSSGRTPADLAEAGGYLKLSASLKNFSQMNELTTMYHYFKGINTPPSPVTPNKIISNNSNNSNVEISSAKPIVPLQQPPKPSTSAQARQQEYMEMSGGSDHDSNRGGECSTINAVTNLNYINVETAKDEEIHRNLDESSASSAEPEIMSNELRIQEPAYYDSQELNNNNKSDAFSQDCLNVLENCQSNRSANSSTGPTPTPPPSSTTPLPSAAARAMSPSNYSVDSDYMQPSNIPVETCKPAKSPATPTLPVPTEEFGDYLMQPSNRPVVSLQAINEPPVEEDSLVQVHFNQSAKPKNGTLRRQQSDASKSSVDDELLEIMNDFKNNVFTIQEVEQLVLSWKCRNDVQQSYKDKQEQLTKMRSEYERLQEQMKEKLKRPTPFERMRKLFSRNKSHSTEENASDAGGDESTKAHRPRSSLSLQSLSSNSSSGRLSTGSACSGASLGDSGTHSDPEDRRVFNASQHSCRVGTPGSLMLDNYLIPPTPRPVSATTPTSPCDSPCLKYFTGPANNRSDSETSENYVMFPSNVPVFPSQQSLDQHQQHDYMNFSGLNTIEETKETADITLQPITIQKPECIYAPIIKRSASDLCSSFKAPPPVSPNAVAISTEAQQVKFNKGKATKMDELTSADELDARTQESLKNLSRSIDGCNASLSLCSSSLKAVSINDCSIQHDYMNV